MNPLVGLLAGALLLASAGCATDSGLVGTVPASSEAVPTSGVAWTPDPASAGPTTAGPAAGPTSISSAPTTAVATSGRLGAVSCAGDQAAARTVAVYRAMLLDPQSPIEHLESPARLYVSSQFVDGDFPAPGVPTGPIAASVLRCLTAGVPGLAPITVVTGGEDPAIPTVATAGIRDFADHAAFVTFGPVSSGNPAKSIVTVDYGGGDVSGGVCEVRLKGAEALSLTAHESWIS
jgi:hypothetical protein